MTGNHDDSKLAKGFQWDCNPRRLSVPKVPWGELFLGQFPPRSLLIDFVPTHWAKGRAKRKEVNTCPRESTHGKRQGQLSWQLSTLARWLMKNLDF